MKIPKYARYDYCNKKACEFLEEYNINTFPVNVIDIIKKNCWGLTKYSEIMKELHCDRETVIRCLQSKDGFTLLDNDNYSIAYNDDEVLGNRIRFTLMHEIGHIYLNHLKDFEATKLLRNSLTNAENRILENEANSFARNVLAPTFMIQQLKDKSLQNISITFGISIAAAKTRLFFFDTDMNLNLNTGLIERLKHIFYKYYYKKKCLTCGAALIQSKGNYCPICGQKTLKWGNGNMIYKETIQLDLSGKAIKCPVCDNEQIISDAEFCHICGTYLINKCDNRHVTYDQNFCGKILPPNARYCPYCGNESTFFNDKVLKSWKEEEEDESLPFN